MNIYIMTLFPDMMKAVLLESIIGRGVKSGAISLSFYHIRDYAEDKHKSVDDTLYGGGMGMLLKAEPIYNCYKAILAKIGGDSDANDVNDVKTVYMSPRGKVLCQAKAEELSAHKHLIILCGHYEGVDQRVLDIMEAQEISIGDYVLTGGELPGAILADCVARLVPGVLSNEECHRLESHSSGLLEYPHYTRPYDFRGLTVPDVLLSGHHANIEQWRRHRSLDITAANRPDMILKNKDMLMREDIEYLRNAHGFKL